MSGALLSDSALFVGSKQTAMNNPLIKITPGGVIAVTLGIFFVRWMLSKVHLILDFMNAPKWLEIIIAIGYWGFILVATGAYLLPPVAALIDYLGGWHRRND